MEQLERIASFSVDHTTLRPGMYLSRQDGDVMTWDLRMKTPNAGDYLSTGGMHALEHLLATYLRNSTQKEHVIYVGPMGCRTGFYLLTQGLSPAQVLDLTRWALDKAATHMDAIPGASAEECGNYQDMDPENARAEASAMLHVLRSWTAADMHYST